MSLLHLQMSRNSVAPPFSEVSLTIEATEHLRRKRVKGRADARISEDIQKNLSIVEKMNLKYLGTLEHPLAKRLMESTRSGNEVVIEITPKFFSAWDFGKAE